MENISEVQTTEYTEHRSYTPVPLELTEELILEFLRARGEDGLSDGTVGYYRCHLMRLYDRLPEGAKQIGPGTIAEMRKTFLEEGYSAQTVNLFLSAANGLLDYCNRRDLQDTSGRAQSDRIQPELTRTEYRRLLSAALALEDDRAYLLTKLFALTGFAVGEVGAVTAEAVRAGAARTNSGATVRFPESFRTELLEYMRREGIRSGPVFATREGSPMHRTVITQTIQRLHTAARVEREKCTPRCLSKLHKQTMATLRENLELLISQSYDRMLEKEQESYGWYTAETGVSGRASVR